ALGWRRGSQYRGSRAMPVEGRDLSSRQTHDVVRDLEIGQPINSEECSETAEGVARESEGRSRLSLLRPVRQDQPRRHPGSCLCRVPLQQGRTGCGRSGLRGHRRVWGAAVAWRTGACAQAGDLSTGAHQKSVHPEGHIYDDGGARWTTIRYETEDAERKARDLIAKAVVGGISWKRAGWGFCSARLPQRH